MKENNTEIDVKKFAQAELALWVGDLARSKKLLKKFMENAKHFVPFGVDDLKEILKRPKKYKEIGKPEYSEYKDEVFIYGPLIIRSSNIVNRISKVDLKALEKEIRIKKTRNFIFRVDEVGVNVYELKGYSPRHLPAEIQLYKLARKLDEKIVTQRGEIRLIDKDLGEHPYFLTFELFTREPIVYAKLHVMKDGIIYGEIHTSKRESAEALSYMVFEGLEEVFHK